VTGAVVKERPLSRLEIRRFTVKIKNFFTLETRGGGRQKGRGKRPGRESEMRLWALKTCDTCRKAEKALRAAGYDLRIVDVRADGVAPADLARMLAVLGEELVNRRSTTWRGLDAAERARPPADLLAAHPTLMKRPVIESEGRLHLGWGPQVQAQLLG
jgi:arsenate reductase